MSTKRDKMLTMWVTQEEHKQLLERCDGKQLAVWMRQVCLNERRTRRNKLPSIDPALLRQLAAIGNNVNQIARKMNDGSWSGADRVSIVAALISVDRGLESLGRVVKETQRSDS